MATHISAIEAAQKLGVGLDYLYSLLWVGKIEGRKVGGRWEVSLASVEARAKEAAERNSVTK